MDERNLERAEQRELFRKLIAMGLLSRETAIELSRSPNIIEALERAGIERSRITEIQNEIAEANYQRTIIEPIAGPNDETIADVPPDQSVSDSVGLEIDDSPTRTGISDISANPPELIKGSTQIRRPARSNVDVSELVQSIAGLFTKREFKQLSKLGQGGMGVVYSAEQTDLGREIVIKKMLIVPPDFSFDQKNPEQVEKYVTELKARTARFIREAKIMSKARHPGVPAVHEIGFDSSDSKPFIAMEQVKGQTLEDIITDGSLSRQQLLDVFVKVCDAMAYAHSQGIAHRDLKPENIMIGQFGEAQVLDWGLAKEEGQAEIILEQDIKDGKATRTQDGTVMGTPHYIAPEQAFSKPERISDIYSLGAILYEILTTVRLRDGSSPHEVIGRAVRDEFAVKSPRKLDPTIPPELEAIVIKALEPDVDLKKYSLRPLEERRRYQSVEELRDDVQAFIRGDFVSAYKYGKFQRAWRRASRHPKKLATAATLMLAAAVGGPAFGKLSESEARAREEAALAEVDAQKSAREAAEATMRENVTRLSVAEAKSKRSDAIVPYWKALDMLDRGEDLEKAVSLLTEAARIDPTWSEPHYQLGRIYHEKTKFDLAIEHLEKANELNIAETQKLDSAGKVISPGKIDVRSLFTAGIASIDLAGQPGTAGKYLQKILEKADDENDSYVLLAKSINSFNSGEMDSAIKFAEQVTQKSKMSEAFFLLSTYYSWGIYTPFNHKALAPYKDYQKALLLLNKAIELDPRLRYFVQRSLVNDMVRKYDDAIADADRVLDSGVQIQTVFFSKASALQNKGSAERNIDYHYKAIEVLNQAERVLGALRDDTLGLRGFIYINLGSHQLRSSDSQKAEQYFQQSRNDLESALNQKESARTRLWLGIAIQNITGLQPDGRTAALEEALKNYDRAIEIGGRFIEAYSHRAGCYEIMGRDAEALSDYEQVAQAGIHEGNYHRGRILARTGKMGEAINALEAYLQSPSNQFRSQAQQLLDKIRQR